MASILENQNKYNIYITVNKHLTDNVCLSRVAYHVHLVDQITDDQILMCTTHIQKA